MTIMPLVSIPSRIGRYAVRRRIGSGAFATVWLAYDEQLDSPVAVKVLAENWTEDHHVRQRFLEEGRFLRKVESPHVVSVYDAGELDDGRPYLVMSYADQGTLADRLEIEGLTPAQAMEVVRQIGLGLTALHERGVLHRDVKPANVLFRTVDAHHDGSPVRAMLADLGLGKALDVSSRLTMIAGTPSFVAPEQAQGEPLDARADQYALAALTHLLLAGEPPFRHASLSAAAAPGPPPELSRPGREFSDAVGAVVRRALDPDRDGRWPDITTYVDALDESLGLRAAGSMPEPWVPLDPNLTQPGPRPTALPADESLPGPRPPRRRPRKVVIAVGAGVLVVALGAAAGYVANRQAADPVEEVSDTTGALSVRVPSSWTEETRTVEWTPPDQDEQFASLSAGTTADWNDAEGDGEGVFIGVLAGEDLPEQLPGHPGCDSVDEPYPDEREGDAMLTQVATGCPGVIVERVRQVATNRYVWIQVRSGDRATANDVLDSIDVSGY